ncbi:hypothetical protein [Tardiphaga sp. OK245]|uniref:hypothetical protein n=1 Tax=Tardiphaga sp. OK245 TaxID=1855306 RepID=UPI0008A7916B|nr:hypothetical protein [Tardiphaga sp. OK245]SEI14609.1 hypothetical protein SAMN05216367_4027 [Tardiphaga sp. OK245]
MFSGFATRFTARMTALVLVASMLTGCAEIDRKGGYIDQIEDAVLFRADTKTHRLLRSYLLATVLLTVARRQGHNDIDSTAIAGALEGALAIANEAYMCLYPGLYERTDDAASFPVDPSKLKSRNSIGGPDEITMWTSEGRLVSVTKPAQQPRWCQFFDEKMSRLDYALFRLAAVTLFNGESRQSLADIQAKLIGRIPVISDTVTAAIHVNKAANQITSIIDDLLNVAFTSAGPVLALLPVYRDSLELNMWVVTDYFALSCKEYWPQTYDAIIAGSATVLDAAPECAGLVSAIVALRKGNGNPKIWRDFLKQISAEYEGDFSKTLPVEAYRPHFFLISQLLVRSCRSVLSDGQKPKRCEQVLTDALEKAAFNADNATGSLINSGGPPTPGRWMTVSLPLPGARMVQLRPRRSLAGNPSGGGTSHAPLRSVGSAPVSAGPDSTGSIGRPPAPETLPQR